MIPRPTLMDEFLAVYPEFMPLAENPDTAIFIEREFDKIGCLYPAFDARQIVGECERKHVFFMLVAHYLVMGGFTIKIGISPSSGIVASSSVDGVSVSYQGTPYGQNAFTHFFGQTRYGMEFLAYMQSRAGIRHYN